MEASKKFTRRRWPAIFVCAVIAGGAVTVLSPSHLAIAGEVAAIAGLFAVLEHFGQRIEISESSILDDRRFISLSVSIDRDELKCCRYKRLILGRPIQVKVIELEDESGRKIIDIRRYGWGRRRKELFGSIRQWVAISGASMDEETLKVLMKWSGEA